MSLPALTELRIDSIYVFQGRSLKISLVEVIAQRIQRLQDRIGLVETTDSMDTETGVDDGTQDLLTETLFLKDVVTEFLLQKSFDVTCRHPPIGAFLKGDSIEKLITFVSDAKAEIDSNTLKAAKEYLGIPAGGEVEDAKSGPVVAVANLKREIKHALDFWEKTQTPLTSGLEKLQELSENVKTTEDAKKCLRTLAILLEQTPWLEYCRRDLSFAFTSSRKKFVIKFLAWWKKSVDGSGVLGRSNVPTQYGQSMYDGKRYDLLTREHVLAQTWLDFSRSIAETADPGEDPTLMVLASREASSSNSSRLNKLLPLFLSGRCRDFRGGLVWDPLPADAFDQQRRAFVARVTCRGYLAYPLVQPTGESYATMADAIVELASQTYLKEETPQDIKLCALWEVGLSFIMWRSLGTGFNPYTMWAHYGADTPAASPAASSDTTTSTRASLESLKGQWDRLLKMRLEESDAIRWLVSEEPAYGTLRATPAKSTPCGIAGYHPRTYVPVAKPCVQKQPGSDWKTVDAEYSMVLKVGEQDTLEKNTRVLVNMFDFHQANAKWVYGKVNAHKTGIKEVDSLGVDGRSYEPSTMYSNLVDCSDTKQYRVRYKP